MDHTRNFQHACDSIENDLLARALAHQRLLSSTLRERGLPPVVIAAALQWTVAFITVEVHSMQVDAGLRDQQQVDDEGHDKIEVECFERLGRLAAVNTGEGVWDTTRRWEEALFIVSDACERFKWGLRAEADAMRAAMIF